MLVMNLNFDVYFLCWIVTNSKYNIIKINNENQLIKINYFDILKFFFNISQYKNDVNKY